MLVMTNAATTVSSVSTEQLVQVGSQRAWHKRWQAWAVLSSADWQRNAARQQCVGRPVPVLLREGGMRSRRGGLTVGLQLAQHRLHPLPRCRRLPPACLHSTAVRMVSKDSG